MLTDQQKLQQAELKEALEGSTKAVFFGGAGVSTESGIPDFRSASGIYNQKFKATLRPEEIISHTFFMQDPETFFDFYKSKMVYLDAKPNACHRKLAQLEREGHLAAVVTQNIDGLHQAAGSKHVIELHGSVLRNHCMECGASYDAAFVVAADGVPYCTKCGGIVKPDVVLYEEGLDERDITGAIEAISNADVLVVAGTSLAVYPAASFINYFGGDKLVVINLSHTSLDRNADLLIEAKVGEVFDW